MPLAEAVNTEQLDWMVPALREERVAHLLQRLPKALRRPLMPLPIAAKEIVRAVDPHHRSFVAAMSEFVRRRYGLAIPVSAWPVKELPEHLRPRFEITGQHDQPLAAGRDLRELCRQIREHQTAAELGAWQNAPQRWERYGLRDWDFGDLPERCLVTDAPGFPLYAYPGLQVEHGDVNLRLFRRPEEATQATREALPRLAERALHRELGWLQKDLLALNKLSVLHVTLGPVEELIEGAWENLRHHLFPEPERLPCNAQEFAGYVEAARQKLPGLGARLVNTVGPILQKRQEALLCRYHLPNMRAEIEAIVPAQFLRRIPFECLPHLPRFLQALIIRAERAALNPAKDAEKARRVEPYLKAARELAGHPVTSPALREQVRQFLRLVEEFKVSWFAQELGTATPVSAQRLDELLAAIRAAMTQQ